MESRIALLIERFPLLIPTVKKLNQASIPFAIGGSGCLYVLGNERVPNDADLYLPDDRHDAADQLFGIQSFFHESPVEKARNSNPENNHDIQLTSQIVLQIEGKEYRLGLTPDVLAKTWFADYQGEKLTFLPPEEALLTKALLQRGSDVGKQDIEDVKNFLKLYPRIDQEYLKQRIQTLDAAERVGNIFK